MKGVTIMNDIRNITKEVGGRVKQTEMKLDDQEAIDPDFIERCLNRNELGDGELYKYLNHGKVIFNKSMNCWLVWTLHHWKIDKMGVADALVDVVANGYDDHKKMLARKKGELEADGKDTGHIKALMKELAKRVTSLRSKARRQNCLFFAHTSDDPMAIEGNELDQNPWLVACSNGVVDLRTGDLRPGRQEDMLLKACPLDYPEDGINADVSLWEGALLDIFSGRQNMVDFFRQVCGSALVGEVMQALFIVMTGRGANGKSMVVKALSEVLGPLAGSIRPEMLLDQNRVANASGATPEIAALRGLLMAFASETDDGCKIASSRVKWLTGNDPLVARMPYDKYEMIFLPTHTLFLMTNHLPHASADDYALWRRMVVIPFDVSFVVRCDPEQELAENERDADPELPGKLKKIYPNILGWLVRGCLEWQKNGYKLIQPAAVKEAGKKYREDEDSVGDFIQECCIVGDGYHVSAAAVYERFEAWWKENVSNWVPKKKRFGQWFTARFEKRKDGTISYYGVGLLNDLTG